MNYTYRATVKRVIDGDTLVLAIDVGFRMVAEMPVRLLGIDSPEANTPRGKRAKAFTEAWCQDHPVITVTTEKHPEKYGRWLGTVQDGDVVLNKRLEWAGYAVSYGGGKRD